jgi:DNA-binding PadR family transcriptional regulator
LGRNLIAIQQPRDPRILARTSVDLGTAHYSRFDVTVRYIERYYGGMLEMAVLGLLKEQDMHGYELKKRLSDVFGLSSTVSFGSLYPALGRLEAAGAVRVVTYPDAQLAPGAGTAGSERRESRRRKVYGITALGATVFEELLSHSQGAGEDERSFNLRLAFARYLPPEGRLGLLEQRRAVLGDRLAQLAARARARRDDRYMRILCERQQDSLSRDVSWLDELIQQERASKPTDAAPTGSVAASPGSEGPASHPPAGTPPLRLVPLASASQLQRGAPGLGAGTSYQIDNFSSVKDGM